MYDGYKANRKGMPNELASQMPILKEILTAMNIKIIEKEGYEADDILGTLAKWGQSRNLEVTILTGDRDSFQLVDESIKVRIPHTTQGKTETDDYTIEKIEEKYGLKPQELIEVKGLAGDSSDNIPGIPGVGEKTAINLVKQYKNIEGIYMHIDEFKGKLKEKIEQNEEMAYMSRTLGTIDTKVPIEVELNEIKLVEWNKDEVLKIFKKLKFAKFIEKFDLQKEIAEEKKLEIDYEENVDENAINEIKKEVKENKKIFYYIIAKEEPNAGIINKEIEAVAVYSEKKNKAYLIKDFQNLKEIFESEEIIKVGYKQKQDYILLKEVGIKPERLMFDIEIAGYLLNSNISKYTIEYLAQEYLQIDIADYLDEKKEEKTEQLNLFEIQNAGEIKDLKLYIHVNFINKLYYELTKKMQEAEILNLFNEIEMPLVEVLADMQYVGIYVDKKELLEFGKDLKQRIDELSKEIYELAGEEFNINSPKQLGEILFEKLKLPLAKKNKTGYSTNVETLEKLKNTHPIINKLLEFRQIGKLNSTYVEGLIPYINEKDNRVHSYFHQTVTATGRISSTEPNLQNIPTRFELGKNLRKVFKATENKIFIDADYSQIELRVLAHISDDTNMIHAFNNDEDIHQQVASKVFDVPMEEVTHEERSKAKAVNFGIVYGISDFGLGEQIGISRKEAKQYIEQYLDKYSGIKKFMETVVEEAKNKTYVETLFNRRRYVPELQSNNYMVRQFGSRVAMNTPIQGTAADIMKKAMWEIYSQLKKANMKSKIILQVHDEILIETEAEEIEKVKEIVKDKMENVIKLKIPLKIELSEAKNLYDAK